MAKRLFSASWRHAAALGLLVPGVAHAQAVPSGMAGSLTLSKSEAILGAPSALERILAQQHAVTVRPAVQPASFSIPRIVPAIVRREGEGVLSGRPDVFGSVALRVGHTPLDARWNAVENVRPVGAAARFSNGLRSSGPVEQLTAINHYVNARVQFEDDQKHFGRPDVWSSVNDTLRSGRGDCEDYAIAKLEMLRQAGFSDRNLYLVIVHDLVRRADHAILVARADGHMFVLDNGTDQLLDDASVSDYRPILTFASYGEWTHGYRVQAPPVYIAQNPVAPVTLASDDQRSRSASLLAFNTGLSR